MAASPIRPRPVRPRGAARQGSHRGAGEARRAAGAAQDSVEGGRRCRDFEDERGRWVPGEERSGVTLVEPRQPGMRRPATTPEGRVGVPLPCARERKEQRAERERREGDDVGKREAALETSGKGGRAAGAVADFSGFPLLNLKFRNDE
ncbi:hypothetical protein BS78_03G372800 [Paspalum vaginatum]|nr:hypothetical protein BS78_03G372800 [Paspalum vaginatum]